ncbi:gap junction beta-5 protein-like isoform X2 [Lissotriton helveticus]
MAAIVTSLVRLFQPSLASMGDSQGPVLWYALLSLRLVALFTADNPWSSLKPDFTCNHSMSAFCTTLCFNNHFDVPLSPLWSFSFLAGVVPVLLMRLVQRGSRKAASQKKDIELMDPVREASPKSSTPGPPQSTSVVILHIACILFLLCIEVVFLWALAVLQLPKVFPHTFPCWADLCPENVECAIFGRTDKQMALATLAFTAGINIVVCVTSAIMEVVQLSRCRKK